MNQESISKFLQRRQIEHITSEMMRADLVYQVMYPLDEDDSSSQELNFRVDGREHEYLPRAPLDAAILGSHGIATDGRIWFIGLDIDGPNKKNNPNPEPVIREWAERLSRIPWLHIYRSKSGNGLHVLAFPTQELYADSPQPFGLALAHRIAEVVGQEFLSLLDCTGSILFYSAPSPGENGFELLSRGVPFTEKLEPVYEIGEPHIDADSVIELEEVHQQHVEWLTQKARKDFFAVGNIYNAHTSDLERMHEALNLLGEFTTRATGQGCAAPLN